MDDDLLDGFLLNGLSVQPTTGQVTGARGERHLPSKPMEVLLMLARQPRRLVTRDAILQKVWGDGHGSPEALSHAISDIRAALDDHASAPGFIQTVPTRGYRLLVTPQSLRHEVSANGRALTGPPDVEPGGDKPLRRATDGPQQGGGFWRAMLRHGVVQASAAYLVAGWLLIQVADATFADIGLPPWSNRFVTFVVIAGFPIVVVLAWFLEFAGGRVRVDDGQNHASFLQGLEQNYFAILLAFGIAGTGAAVYQVTTGFAVPESVMSESVELLPVTENSLAVLKLVTFGDDERLQLLALGISEDLIDALAKLPGVVVASRGDAWSLPDNATSDLVRQRLRVAHFVEGSIRLLDQNTLRVVVQLVDSATGFHIASRAFDRELSGFAVLEDEITQLVVANLRLALDDQSPAVTTLTGEQPAIDTYLLYRRGIEALHASGGAASIEAAIIDFRAALEEDADYPAAHAGLCIAYRRMFSIQRDPDNIAKAEAECSRAYAVAPQLPQVLSAVGALHLETGRNEPARQVFRRALEINPRYVQALRGLAEVAARDLDFEGAEALGREAIELQPGNWRSMSWLASLYYANGRYTDAKKLYQKILFLNPDNFEAVGNLGAVSMMAGDFVTARDAMQRSLDIDFDPRVAANLGVMYYYLGDFDNAVAMHRRAVTASPNSSGSRINLADALHFLGDANAAADAFRQGIVRARSDLSVNPDDPEALLYLAWGLAMTGESGEGRRYADRALEIAPHDPYSYYYLGLILLLDGETTAAVDAFRSALNDGYPVTMLAAEPYLRPLANNSRYQNLLEEFGHRKNDK